MIPATTFRGQRVALFGLGGSGLATAKSLGGRRCPRSSPGTTIRPRSRRSARPGSDSRRPERDNRLGFPECVWCCRPACRSPIPSRTGRRSSQTATVSRSSAMFPRFSRASGGRLHRAARSFAITGTNGKSTTTRDDRPCDRPFGPRPRPAWRQYSGTAVLTPRAARARSGAMLLNARPTRSTFFFFLAPSLGSERRAAAQPHPGSSRPPWLDAALRRRQDRVWWSTATWAIIGDDDDWCRGIAARLEACGATVERDLQGSCTRPWACSPKARRSARRRNGVVTDLADLSAITTLRGAHNAQNAGGRHRGPAGQRG